MKNKNTLTIIGIIMLLLAIPSGFMPYGYYQFLRIAITILAGYLCFLSYEQKKQSWSIIMAGIAILFNPIFRIYLSKSTWALWDFVAAVIFFISLSKINQKMN